MNINNMNIMGGPVGGLGGQMPMMNNGAPIPQPAQQQQQRHQRAAMEHRTLLNTYVYEYFLRNNMLDCARAMVQSDVPIHYNNRKEESDMNGMGSDPMDTDSKDPKHAGELPEPAVPNFQNTDGCFLYEWFCLFWEMFNAQRGKSNHGQINQYIDHTQAQSRLKQNQQQEMLRNLRPDQLAMMRNMNTGATMMKQNSLARTAMANNQNPNAMMMQAKQMQRDPSDMDGNRQRPGSPSSTENAPSPSKRPRLDGPPGFNPNQHGMIPNGRPAPGAPGQQVGSVPNSGNNAQLMQMLLSNGITPASLTPQQFQNFANQPPAVQAKAIQAYAQNISQHQSAQMPNKQMPNPGGPQGQGSPMMAQGPDGTATLNAYYNPNEMGAAGGMRPGPGGAQPSGGSNHALQDYQMQLMLLEQQNKKRLMMARQEQDNPPNQMPRTDGPPGLPGPPGQVPNGQPFTAGDRAAGSPNPTDQMKRGTPQMNNAGIPSPLPEGAQSRGSPNAMSFMPNQMDPNGGPSFYKPGMDGSMTMNGPMRPPSSHPNQQFNGQQVAPTMMARQQQGQPGAPGGPGMQWQGGPQGGPQGPQGPQPGPQGPRPVQNAPPGTMAPPAPPAGGAANARNQTSSPQNTAQPPTPSQTNKPNPKKKDSKSAKDKRAATQKKSANHNAGATPAPENTQDNEPPPTPATPITPGVNFAPGKSAQPAPAAQPMPNGQTPAAAPAPAQVAPQPGQDPNQNGTFGMDSNMNPEFPMNFADPLTSNDVLDSFDFESFLQDEDGTVGPFDFNTQFGPMETEINAD